MPFLDETASAPLSKMGAVLARSARGLAVPRPGPVCLSPPQRHTVSLQLRVKSRSRGALSSRPGFPSDEAPPRSGFFALPHPLSEQFVAPHAGTCWGFDWPRAEPGDEAAEARHRDGLAPPGSRLRAETASPVT